MRPEFLKSKFLRIRRARAAHKYVAAGHPKRDFPAHSSARSDTKYVAAENHEVDFPTYSSGKWDGVGESGEREQGERGAWEGGSASCRWEELFHPRLFCRGLTGAGSGSSHRHEVIQACQIHQASETTHRTAIHTRICLNLLMPATGNIHFQATECNSKGENKTVASPRSLISPTRRH